MGLAATVLVPTHNHGRLLELAVGSALAQSIPDIEILIVGDGVDEATREVAIELCKGDDRVRFFDNEKGPRHGEIHRHAALQHATGQIVCYLSDDDLWLRDHIATMLEMLQNADFAHSLPVGIRTDGSMMTWVGDLSVSSSRKRVVENRNFIPLSCGAHTLDQYKRLPYGWRTTPSGIHTDVYMWSQILSDAQCVARSGNRATTLHFPSSLRPDMTLDDRLSELTTWQSRTGSPSFEPEFTALAISEITRDRVGADELIRQLRSMTNELEEQRQSLHSKLEDQQAELETEAERQRTLETRLEDMEKRERDVEAEQRTLETRLEEIEKREREAEYELKALTSELARNRLQLKDADRQLGWMSSSLTWRTRATLLRIPGVSRITRWAAVARGRRSTR